MQSVHTDYYFKKHFLEISQLYAKKKTQTLMLNQGGARLPAMDQTRHHKGLIKLTQNIKPLYCKRHYEGKLRDK